jgi:hypothetical protein
MVASQNEMFAVFESAYDDELQIEGIKGDIKSTLESFAESADIEKGSVRKAYTLYKKYKKGDMNITDDDYYTMVSLIEQKFLDEGAKS